MKLFGSAWRRYEYTPIAAGPQAVALDPAAVGAARTFFDCVLVRIATEDDGPGLAAAAVRAVCAATGECGYLLVTAAPGDRPPAHDLVAEIAERLEERGRQVHLLPSGWTLDHRGEPLPACWERRVTAGPVCRPAAARRRSRGRLSWMR
jgi:hypothetical protein